MSTIIVGAGLSGLIAAHALRTTPVFEAGPRRDMHKALLRFRTQKVSHLTGIPFRKVRVRKGIFFQGAFHKPNIQLANLYQLKCLGHFHGGDRSIWNLESAERYIAPDDFYDRMVDQIGERLHWEQPVDYSTPERKISTAPLHVVANALGMGAETTFAHQRITVERFHIPDADLFQTVYFPGTDTKMYRASITGSTLIVEYAAGSSGGSRAAEQQIEQAFGIPSSYWLRGETVKQKYGKISPIDECHRKALISALTTHHGVYSLGRFATWRNILLDDVVDDIAVIQRLLDSGEYERMLAGA